MTHKQCILTAVILLAFPATLRASPDDGAKTLRRVGLNILFLETTMAQSRVHQYKAIRLGARIKLDRAGKAHLDIAGVLDQLDARDQDGQPSKVPIQRRTYGEVRLGKTWELPSGPSITPQLFFRAGQTRQSRGKALNFGSFGAAVGGKF